MGWWCSCKTRALQPNRHYQRTNSQLSVAQMPFLSPSQQCQSIKGKTHICCSKNAIHSNITFRDNATARPSFGNPDHSVYIIITVTAKTNQFSLLMKISVRNLLSRVIMFSCQIHKLTCLRLLLLLLHYIWLLLNWRTYFFLRFLYVKRVPTEIPLC